MIQQYQKQNEKHKEEMTACNQEKARHIQEMIKHKEEIEKYKKEIKTCRNERLWAKGSLSGVRTVSPDFYSPD